MIIWYLTFQLQNNAKTDLKLRLEYAIYYQKANKTLSKKVYKISEKMYAKNTVSNIEKKQSFKQISTRKFHNGLHKIAIVVCGLKKRIVNFRTHHLKNKKGLFLFMF